MTSSTMSWPTCNFRSGVGPRIHSTNTLERFNGEIKRRTDVLAVFPNELPICHVLGMLQLEQNDGCHLQRRCMALETLAEVGDNPGINLSAVTV